MDVGSYFRFFYAFSIFSSVLCFSTTLEAGLRNSLYSSYEVKTRPTTQVKLIVTFMPITLNELNIKDETMTMTGYYSAVWDDPRLDWSSDFTYASMTDIYSTSTETWRPLLIVHNSVSGASIIDDETNLMRIQNTGKVWWTQPFVLKTYCSCDITYYPFDTQTCAITLSTWSYSRSEVDMQFHRKRVLDEFYRESGEWQYISFDTSITEEDRDARGYVMSNVFFTFRRRPQFIVLNTIVPMIFLSFLSCLTFYVSIDAGEKIGYCLTVMLAYAVYLTIVSDTMPTTSVNTSILSIYLVFGLALDILSVPTTLFIIKCHNQSSEKPIPRWTRGITSCFRVLLCEGKSCCCSKSRTKVQNIISKNAKENLSDDECETELEWSDVSRVWDSFFLRFYLALVTLVTVALLLVLFHGYNK